jgi:hypothetical protein
MLGRSRLGGSELEKEIERVGLLVFVRVSKRKVVFVKDDVARGYNATRRHVKTAIAAMRGGVTEKNARGRARSEFVGGCGRLVWVTKTTEYPKVGVGGSLVVEDGEWDTKIYGLARATVEEIGGGSKGLGPVGRGHVRLE